MIKLKTIFPRRSLLDDQAFTLLEILLGLTIFAIIAGSLYGTFFSAWQMQKRAQNLDRTHREANWALERMAHDLENILAYDMTGSYPQQAAFSGEEDKVSFLIGTDNGLKFVSYHLESPQTTKIHQVVLAEKTKKNSAVTVGQKQEGAKTVFLVREETDFAGHWQKSPTDDNADIEILSTRVAAEGLKFKFAYQADTQDEEKRDWRPRWSRNYNPAGVHIAITFILPDKKETPLVFTRDVYIPTGSWGADESK